MKEELVSIIMPVYNNETTVLKSIYSVLSQTYTNWELIIIDDGSTDKSFDICMAESRKEKRIKSFHQQNKGVSSARNLGLKQMQGDYFCFIDSDDTYKPTFIESLLSAINDNGADIAVCSWAYEYDGGVTKRHTVGFSGLLSKDEALKIMLTPYGYRGYLCTKIFKKNLCTKNNISLDEDLKMMEDLDFVVKYMVNAKDAYFIDVPLYNYYMRSDSAIHSLPNIETLKSFDKILPSVKLNFSRECQETIRWNYYATLLQVANSCVDKSQRKRLLDKIAVERRYFLNHKKYSIWGYFRKIRDEIKLRFI